MNTFDQDFKEHLQSELNEQSQSVFTKKEREAVLSNIRKEKRENHVLPKLLMASAAVVGFFLTASLFSEKEQPSTNSATQIEEESLTFFDWIMDSGIGITVNGWVIKSKTEEEPKKIVFAGNDVITGKVYEENNRWFINVENYEFNLPVDFGRDNNELILTFHEALDSDEKMTFNSNVLNTITAKEIIATYEDGATVYTVTDFDFGDTSERFIYDKNNLPEHLQSVYAMLKNGEINLEKMKELMPIDVFNLFLYAEEQADYEVQYALLNHDNNKMAFASYEEYEKSSGEDRLIKLSGAFENQQIKQVLVDESSAYIIPIDLERQIGSFRLNKSADGTWKVKLLPYQ